MNHYRKFEVQYETKLNTKIWKFGMSDVPRQPIRQLPSTFYSKW